jgi:hypothetical protein
MNSEGASNLGLFCNRSHSQLKGLRDLLGSRILENPVRHENRICNDRCLIVQQLLTATSIASPSLAMGEA